jgi:hypothetical protein
MAGNRSDIHGRCSVVQPSLQVAEDETPSIRYRNEEEPDGTVHPVSERQDGMF